MTLVRDPSDFKKPNLWNLHKLALGVDLAAEFDVPSEAFTIIDHYSRRSKHRRNDSEYSRYYVTIIEFIGDAGCSCRLGHFFETSAKALVSVLKEAPRRTQLPSRIVKRFTDKYDLGYYFDILNT